MTVKIIQQARDGMSHANDRKGNYWTLAADCTPMFDNGNYKRRRIKRTPPYAARFSSVVENNQLSYLRQWQLSRMHGATALDPMHMMLMGGSLPYQMSPDLSAVGMSSFDQAGHPLTTQPLPSYNSAFFPAGTSGILCTEAKSAIDIKPSISNDGQDIQPNEQHYMASTNKNLDMVSNLENNQRVSVEGKGFEITGQVSLPYEVHKTLYANAGSSTMAALMPSYGSTTPWSLPTINSFSDHETTSLYTYNGNA
uniref:Fork-head domain-containing protein n=1 Tax=Angiostrongylus cantonensis TaxID=6313 RepID=A0A0K0CWL8_ANGCA